MAPAESHVQAPMTPFVRVLLAALLAAGLALAGLALLRPTPTSTPRSQTLLAEPDLRPSQSPFRTAPGPQPLALPKASRPAPGREVTVQLSEAPAVAYLAAIPNENDKFYASLVRELSRGRAVSDADLGRAAREFVFQYTEFGEQPQSDVRDFLIRGAGAVAGDTVFQHLRTNSDDEASLRKAIASVLAEPSTGTGPLHVGVGEVFMPGATWPRHIGVVATRMPIALSTAARTAEPGTIWRLGGRLHASYSDLKALVLHPDGNFVEITPDLDGDRLSLAVPVGEAKGPLDVQLVGTGPEGPGKLVQLPIEVGQPPPRAYTTRLAADERALKTADDAAAHALVLVNADRAQHGLHALHWDAELARVARDHSVDMRDHGFFGHVSPTTGLHTARLEAARYRAVASAENLAHNVSIAEAQAGLMHSLGHRRNLLDPDVTHLGIGIAGADEDGQRRWWLTQLFARPVQAIDAEDEVRRLRLAIGEKRQDARALRHDDALDEVARDAARTALDGELQDVSAQALAAARTKGLLRGKLRAWAALVPDVRRLTLPAMVAAAEARRLGIGIVQDAVGLDGRVAVVLLVAD